MAWKIIEEGLEGSKVWQNTKNPKITVEIHPFEAREAKEIGAKWYVFPAKNGKGIPESPELATTKKEALKISSRLRKKYSSKLGDVI